MYPEHLGTGQTIELDQPPMAHKSEVLFSHEYVANEVARHMSDTSGVWFSNDSNLYAYVGNNPINRIDPMGLFWVSLTCVDLKVLDTCLHFYVYRCGFDHQGPLLWPSQPALWFTCYTNTMGSFQAACDIRSKLLLRSACQSLQACYAAFW